jgi:chemotaxis protein MotB
VWVIASILVLIMGICYISFMAWDRSRDLGQVREQLKEAKAQLANALAQLEKQQQEAVKADSEFKDKIGQYEDKFNQYEAQLDALRKEKEAAVAGHGQFEKEMRAALESKDVTISQLQGKLTVNILDRVMFESGEAVLKPDGEAVLLKAAEVLKMHPTLMVHVVGHTDNVPIRTGARERFASNWELSTARALAAVRFLSEKGGMDPRRLGAVGYGEYHPIADNSTEKGRAKNRRIAITVVSDEIVGSDAALAPSLSTVKTNAAPAHAVPHAEAASESQESEDANTPATE